MLGRWLHRRSANSTCVVTHLKRDHVEHVEKVWARLQGLNQSDVVSNQTFLFE